jgi:hypothetical protein
MRTKLIVAILTMLALGGLTTATSAAAAPAEDRAHASSLAPRAVVGFYRIHSYYDDNQCLNSASATTVQMWTCNYAPSATQQRWALHLINGSFVLENTRYATRVLDADPAWLCCNDTLIRLVTYSGATNQHWSLREDLAFGGFRFDNLASGRALDADRFGMFFGNGARVRLWDYGLGASNQRWRLEAVN